MGNTCRQFESSVLGGGGGWLLWHRECSVHMRTERQGQRRGRKSRRLSLRPILVLVKNAIRQSQPTYTTITAMKNHDAIDRLPFPPQPGPAGTAMLSALPAWVTSEQHGTQ